LFAENFENKNSQKNFDFKNGKICEKLENKILKKNNFFETQK